MEAKKTIIMRIYEILREYSDVDHPLRQQDIIDLLRRDYGIECERKAVSRNLSYLKEMGVDIENDFRGSYLASRPFENSELRLLIDSVLCSRNINAAHSAQLIKKLIAQGGRYFKSHVKHVYTIGDRDKSTNYDFFLNIELADEAIEQGKKITFAYNKVGVDGKLHETSRHTASPYQMLLNNQRYYLMVYDEKYEKISFLRMDKITEMQILSDYAKPLREVQGYERGINYRELSLGLPYMYSGKPEKTTLRCNEGMADALYDWFGNNFAVLAAHEGKIDVSVRANQTAMLYWVLQYNDAVEVLSPPSLRQAVKDKLRSTLDLYDDD